MNSSPVDTKLQTFIDESLLLYCVIKLFIKKQKHFGLF
jgi:hypothetical protein